MEEPNAVDSRWWYWIAAYPIAFLVVMPALLFFGLLGIIPFVLLGVDVPGALAVFGFLAVGLLVIVLGIGLFLIFVLLPFALYFDAKAVGEADVDWSPDPTVFALLAAVQFVATPVGLVVSVYYLYRRYEMLG